MVSTAEAISGRTGVPEILLLGLGRTSRLCEEISGLLREGGRVVAPHEGKTEAELDRLLSSVHPALAVVASRRCSRPRLEALVRALRRRSPRVPILVASEEEDAESILGLLQLGVDDYVTVPFTEAQVLPRLARLLERGHSTAVADSEVQQIEGLVGRSRVFRELAEQIRSVAACDATVLIEGETGTGKELVARAIHQLSDRSEGPFSPIDCGALPGELIQNELFGHRRAAFTGASVSQNGLIREAEGGSLFLDEIDCLSPISQRTLLRFVQQLEYRPLGASRIVKADVRIIAATNADLQGLVERGEFRQDLYYRLDVLRLKLPPLRDRLEDVPLLAEHFVNQYAHRFGSPAECLSCAAKELLLKQDWPGNVRELEHVVERAVALSRRSEVVRARHLLLEEDGRSLLSEPLRVAKKRVVEKFERSYIRACLAAHGGNIARAARAADKNRRAFWELMRKHSIDAESFRTPAIPSATRRPITDH